MNQPPVSQAEFVASTVGKRVGAGPNAMVSGWQAMLTDLLTRMRPYLQPGRMVTFRDLRATEKNTFEHLLQSISIPAAAVGLYLPPSVRNQIMYTNRGEQIPDEAQRRVDDGAALFCRHEEAEPLVNVLLARPPHTASIDVYCGGALLAGYTYRSVSECIAHLQKVVTTHLELPEADAD